MSANDANVNDVMEEVLTKIRTRRALPAPAVLRALREEAGLSEEDVARVLKVAPASVSRYEAGRRTPRDPQVVARYVALLARLKQA